MRRWNEDAMGNSVNVVVKSWQQKTTFRQKSVRSDRFTSSTWPGHTLCYSHWRDIWLLRFRLTREAVLQSNLRLAVAAIVAEVHSPDIQSRLSSNYFSTKILPAASFTTDLDTACFLTFDPVNEQRDYEQKYGSKYTVSKKQDTKLLFMSSPSIDRFLKFTVTLSRKFAMERSLQIHHI